MPGREKERSRKPPDRLKDLDHIRQLIRDISDRLLSGRLEPLAPAVREIEAALDDIPKDEPSKEFFRGALFALAETCRRHDARIAHLHCRRCGEYSRTFYVLCKRSEKVRACDRCRDALRRQGWKAIVRTGYGS